MRAATVADAACGSIAHRRAGISRWRRGTILLELLKGPSPAELFTPKLVTVLREGYGARDLRADVLAGLTVAIVALPLSMAIAIASGVGPERGLFTAIIGGFLISALGGSRFQIGGPAAAFTVLVAGTVGRHGIDGMLLATADGRRVPAADRRAAVGQLHQVHPLPGDRGVHLRHRGHPAHRPGRRFPRAAAPGKSGRHPAEA